MKNIPPDFWMLVGYGILIFLIIFPAVLADIFGK